MDSFADSLKTEKISDQNYYTWKQKIMLVFALRDLDYWVEDDPDEQMEDSKRKKWKREDRKARSLIRLSLSVGNLEHVRDSESTKTLWNAIKNLFKLHSLLNKHAARRKFYTVSMEIGEKMLAYINCV